MTEELPEGWAHTTLGEVTEPKVAQTTPSGSSHFTYIDIAGINNTRKVIADAKSILVKDAPSRARQLVETGDVLVSMTRPNLNAVAIVPAALHGSIASTGFHVLRPKNTLPEWVFGLVRSTAFVATMSELVQGALYPAVRPSDIRDFQIPIPPLPEQRRIVAKIEELTARSRAARAALADVPTLLEQFRQSLLASAFRGDLTADWRAEHPDIEPASELLVRMRAERRKQWEAKHPSKKYVEPDPVDDSDLPEVPEGWCWSALGEIGRVERGRFLVRPRNDPSYYSGPYPFVQIGDLPPTGGDIRRFEQTLNEKGLAVSRMFPSGTALIAIVGATIGNTGLLTFDSCCPDSLVGIQALTGLQTRYVEIYMRSKKLEIRRVSYASGGQPNINLQTLLPYPIPLPPEQEVIEIVKRVDHAIESVERLCRCAEEAIHELDTLDQSILAKAFRGELVPQDPTDEPASVLLERLRSGHSEPKASKAITRGKLSRIVLLLLHHWNNAASRELVDRGMLLMLDDDVRQRLASGGSKPKRKKRGTPTSAPPISFPHLLGAMIDAGFVTAKMKGPVQTLHANTQKAKQAHDTADAADLARLRETLKVMELIEEKQLDAELAEAFRGQEIALTV